MHFKTHCGDFNKQCNNLPGNLGVGGKGGGGENLCNINSYQTMNLNETNLRAGNQQQNLKAAHLSTKLKYIPSHERKN